MKPLIVWKPSTGKYAWGSDCFVGPYRVASTVHGVGTRDGKNEKLWQGISYLPGIAIRQDLNHFTTEADAKTVVELVVEKWFTRIAPALHGPQKSED